MKVIHRDIKLGNLFLTKKMELKLGDFGLAVRIEYPDQRRKSILGTPNYIAPEVLNSKIGHSYEADLWALGVIIYIMLIGRAPFETQDLETTYKRINNAEFTFPCHINLSESSKNFIREILVVDPDKRLKLETIMDHEFFKEDYPLLMPESTLICPPSISYTQKFDSNKLDSTEKLAE